MSEQRGRSDAMLTLSTIIERFDAAPVPVIGDLIADIYVTARTERVSREAPVLVLRHQSEEVIPGGAGNVIWNMVRLGGRPVPLGWVGDDQAGHKLIGIFESWSLPIAGIAVAPGRATPSKTRILAGDVHVTPHQVLRLDRGGETPLSAAVRQSLEASLVAQAFGGGALVVSDYGSQTIDAALRERLLNRPESVRMLVDSRFDLLRFPGAYMVLPNEPEASALLARELRDERLESDGAELYQRLQAEHIVLTRGNRGLLLFDKGRLTDHIAASGATEVVDTTGAGDTVTATAALAISAGATPRQAAFLANLAAGISVGRPRNDCATRDDLLNALDE